MTVEIDEQRLAVLNGAERLMNELLQGKTARKAHELIKEHHPEHKVPLSAEELLEESKAEMKRILEAERKAEREKRLEDKFQSDLDSYRLSSKNPNGYTDEGIEKIKSLMRENTIPDVHAAVAYFEKLNPPKSEPPSGYTPTGWNWGRAPADENTKLLFNDPDAWSDQEARKVWEEFRKEPSG